jgi:hypothetical protein
VCQLDRGFGETGCVTGQQLKHLQTLEQESPRYKGGALMSSPYGPNECAVGTFSAFPHGVIGGPERNQKAVPWMAYTDAEVEEVRIVMTIYRPTPASPARRGATRRRWSRWTSCPSGRGGGVARGARRKRTKAEAEAETFLHHAKRPRAGAGVGVRAGGAGARVGVGKRARK